MHYMPRQQKIIEKVSDVLLIDCQSAAAPIDTELCFFSFVCLSSCYEDKACAFLLRSKCMKGNIKFIHQAL